MSRQYVWGPTNIPPKCKLDRCAKQALVAKAEAFIADFYRPTLIQEPFISPDSAFSATTTTTFGLVVTTTNR